MNKLTSLGIKARPLDFFVAFLVFFMGIYGFLDPNFPEGLNSVSYWVIMVEDIYLIVAGVAIMGALVVKQYCRRNMGRWFVGSLIVEMFGWLFISSASAVIALTTPWIPPSAFASTEGPLLWVWFFLWGGLAAASFVRYLDIRSIGRRI